MKQYEKPYMVEINPLSKDVMFVSSQVEDESEYEMPWDDIWEN